MKIVKLNCPSCGGPISVPEEIEKINCANCGSFLMIDRGEGYVALKLIEKITQVIENSGKQTTEAVMHNTITTKSELQKMQLHNELVALTNQLSSLQTEIRSLTLKSEEKKVKYQLASLHLKEFHLMDEIRVLEQRYLNPGVEKIDEVINAIEHEKKWLVQQIDVLKMNFLPDWVNLSKKLSSRIVELDQKKVILQTIELKKKFLSFQITNVNKNDLIEVKNYIYQLEIDLKEIRPYVKTKAGEQLQYEMQVLRQEYFLCWKKLEEERVKGLLSQPGSYYNEDDLNVLYEYQAVKSGNLNTLNSQIKNDVVIRLITEQEKDLNKITSRIKAVEKRQNNEREKLAKKQMQDLTGVVKKTSIFAGIAAILGALYLYFKNLPGFFAKSNVTKSTSFIADGITGGEIEKSAESIQVAGLRKGTSPFIIAGAGLLISLIVFVIISFIGMIFTILLSLSDDLSIPVVFFLLAVSHAISFYIFIRNTMSSFTVRGFLGIPDIQYKGNGFLGSIKNRYFLKISIAFAVLLFLFLFVMSVTFIINLNETDVSNTFSVIFFLLGGVFSLIFAAIVSKRIEVRVTS